MKDITSITEDVRKVLPAAYGLECSLIELYSSACKEYNSHYSREFERYPVGFFCNPLNMLSVLKWANSKIA